MQQYRRDHISSGDPVLMKLRDYNKDKFLSKLYQTFDNVWPDEKMQKKRVQLLQPAFTRRDNILWYESNKRVPRQAVGDILRLGHDSRTVGHFGFEKTLGRLERYHWSSKSQGCRIFCSTCGICHQQKDHGALPLNDSNCTEIP